MSRKDAKTLGAAGGAGMSKAIEDLDPMTGDVNGREGGFAADRLDRAASRVQDWGVVLKARRGVP